MYHTGQLNPVISGETDYSPGQGVGDLIDYAVFFLRRHYIIIGVVTVLASSLGVVYLRYTPPSFTASAKLMLDARNG